MELSLPVGLFAMIDQSEQRQTIAGGISEGSVISLDHGNNMLEISTLSNGSFHIYGIA